MRPCTALQGSSAIYERQLFGAAKQLRSCASKASGAASDNHNATVAKEEHQSESFRIDHNEKTINTAVGDLPLSPVMDATFWEARDRFKKRKPNAGKPENVFERQFRKNPFAQALATPVRYDSVTRTRMPSFFFQDFNIVAHPETNAPWWVPRSLVLHESPISPTSVGNEDDVSIEDIGVDVETGQEAAMEPEEDTNVDDAEAALEAIKAPEAESGAQVSDTKAARGHVLGPTAYVLARQGLLKSFQDEGKKGKGRRTPLKDIGNSQFYKRLFGPSSSRFRALSGRAVWREDMDEFVLDQMRQQIAQDILYLSGLCETDSRYYIVKCYGWDDIQFKHKGAVLWFGGEGQGSVNPGPFATFDINAEGNAKTSVVVHNMPMLLGTELAKKIQAETTVLQNGTIFMLAGRRTNDLQLRLWKLQGYMYDFEGPT